MEEVSSNSRKRKLKRGYLDFDIGEPKILVDENGKPPKLF